MSVDGIHYYAVAAPLIAEMTSDERLVLLAVCNTVDVDGRASVTSSYLSMMSGLRGEKLRDAITGLLGKKVLHSLPVGEVGKDYVFSLKASNGLFA